MRVSGRTIILVLVAVVALLATAAAMHRDTASEWHSRLRAAIHGR
jgi:hypothetical protein